MIASILGAIIAACMIQNSMAGIAKIDLRCARAKSICIDRAAKSTKDSEIFRIRVSSCLRGQK